MTSFCCIFTDHLVAVSRRLVTTLAASTAMVLLSVEQLALMWVVAGGYTVLVCNEPLKPSQPPTLSDTRNEQETQL